MRNKDSGSIVAIFFGLCAGFMMGAFVMGAGAALSWSKHSEPPKVEIAAPACPTKPELASATVDHNADQKAPIHAIEDWWKFHQQQLARGRQPAANRAAPKRNQETATEIAERSWGDGASPTDKATYDQPRYLGDTTRWPLHGPDPEPQRR
jgi:hypothetical protein